MPVFSLSTTELLADFCLSQPLQVEVKNHAHRFRLFLVDNISSVHAVVADDITRAIQYAVVAADFLSGTDTFGDFTAFLLSEGRHNRQTQFAVAIHRPDVIFDEVDLYAVVLEFSRHDEGIHRIAGKAADFAGDDQVILILL